MSSFAQGHVNFKADDAPSTPPAISSVLCVQPTTVPNTCLWMEGRTLTFCTFCRHVFTVFTNTVEGKSRQPIENRTHPILCLHFKGTLFPRSIRPEKNWLKAKHLTKVIYSSSPVPRFPASLKYTCGALAIWLDSMWEERKFKKSLLKL